MSILAAAAAAARALAAASALCDCGAAGSAVTVLEGDVPPFIIDPVSFALIVQNNSGFSLAASGNTCSLMSYNQALND